MHRLIVLMALAWGLAASTGCQLWMDTAVLSDQQSLLRVAQAPPDAVPIDVYWARFAWGDAALNETLWQTVQEDRLPVDVRQRLAANGLRAGIISGPPPQAIADLLASKPANSAGTSGEVPLIETPRVERRLLNVRPGQTKEENATQLLDEATLLVQRAGELSGRTYVQAQGVYTLAAARTSDARVRLELTPEVRHGQPRLKWQQPQPGVMVQNVTRESDVFTDLRLYAELSAGEILIVLGDPAARGQLGDLFHSTSEAGQREQRMLILRLGSELPAEVTAKDRESLWPAI